VRLKVIFLPFRRGSLAESHFFPLLKVIFGFFVFKKKKSFFPKKLVLKFFMPLLDVEKKQRKTKNND